MTKTFLILTMSLLAANAFASTIHAKDATAIMTSADKIGGLINVGGGSSSLDLTDVQCFEAGLANPKPNYFCTLSANGETQTINNYDDAKGLYSSLVANGLSEDVGGGSSVVSAKEISCEEHGNSEGKPVDSCTIKLE